MAFPSTNPIDAGWLPRNIPIDHLGSAKLKCPVCACPTDAEKYVILLGGNIGFGAPFFISPFLKRRSTAGKFGGKRVTVIQCRKCKSMFAFDAPAREWMRSNGVEDGVMSDAASLKMMNNKLAAKEKSAPPPPPAPVAQATPTRATKIPD